MLPIHLNKAVLQRVQIPLFTQKELDVAVLRIDEVHPVISGNKWFKLQPYLQEAVATAKKRIITFGGAWSNHIVATAAAAQAHGLQSIGIIRGEAAPQLSATLLHAQELGMQLRFVSRASYAASKLPFSPEVTDLVIPEGGYGSKGAGGAEAIAALFATAAPTHVLCAVGSGTMMAGLVNAGCNVTGILVLKDLAQQMEQQVRTLVKQPASFTIQFNYHWGGYARHHPALFDAMNDWYRNTAIPSDFVYTGKLFYALQDLAQHDYFPAGSRVICIHSGGLQGNASLPKGTLIF